MKIYHFVNKEYVDSKIKYVPINEAQKLDGTIIKNELTEKSKLIDVTVKCTNNLTRTFRLDTRLPIYGSSVDENNACDVTYRDGSIILGKCDNWYLIGIMYYM